MLGSCSYFSNMDLVVVWLLPLVSCGCCGLVALGNAVRYAETVQGLMFYRSKL